MAGRPRKAEPDVALDAAMKAFWARGYQATSMTELTEATGLHKASLYQTFGDKHALFVTALDSYCQSTLQTLKTCRQAEADVVAVLQASIINKCSEGKGCLAVNSLVEMAQVDPEVEKLIKQFRQRVETFFTALIEQGKANKQISKKVEGKLSARLLTVFLFGITTNMAAGMSANKARALMQEQLRLCLQLTRKQLDQV